MQFRCGFWLLVLRSFAASADQTAVVALSNPLARFDAAGPLALLPEEDFALYRGFRPRSARKRYPAAPLSPRTKPDGVDWRDPTQNRAKTVAVTSVKDQGVRKSILLNGQASTPPTTFLVS